MSELTPQELRDKLKKVEDDIKNATADKAREVLTQYADYLKDEIKILEQGQ
jgi:predicted  nucleic acid-binding Zn-ribbon protein